MVVNPYGMCLDYELRGWVHCPYLFFLGLGSFGGLGAPQEGQYAGRSWIHPTDEAFRGRVSAPCIQTPALQLNRTPLLDYFVSLLCWISHISLLSEKWLCDLWQVINLFYLCFLNRKMKVRIEFFSKHLCQDWLRQTYTEPQPSVGRCRPCSVNADLCCLLICRDFCRLSLGHSYSQKSGLEIDMQTCLTVHQRLDTLVRNDQRYSHWSVQVSESRGRIFFSFLFKLKSVSIIPVRS